MRESRAEAISQHGADFSNSAGRVREFGVHVDRVCRLVLSSVLLLLVLYLVFVCVRLCVRLCQSCVRGDHSEARAYVVKATLIQLIFTRDWP